MKIFTNIFEEIISLENLFQAWDEFKKGKLKKSDVAEFEWSLEQNIISLHQDLKYHRYKHAVYTSFLIHDPKQRKINKASVRDRVLHHAIFRILNPIFEPMFISHSFSCRIDKGNHKGVDSLARMLNNESKNGRQTCYALKCDIRKFFDSVNHRILISLINNRIKDKEAMELFKEIIGSFPDRSRLERERERESKISAGNFTQESLWNSNISEPRSIGIPIGNLTSQWI